MFFVFLKLINGYIIVIFLNNGYSIGMGVCIVFFLFG